MSKIQILFFILGCYAVKETWAVSCGYYSTTYGLHQYKYCSDYCCSVLSTKTCCYYSSYSYSYTYVSYVSNTLSAGIIAAIVIGCLVPIIIIAVICACVCCAANRRTTRTTGVVYASQPAGVTTVTSASASQAVATPAYPGQPAPVYNIQRGYSGQINAGYSQPPPQYEAHKY